MRKVLVTGASGFIGKALINALMREGYSVCAVIRHLRDQFPVSGDITWCVIDDLGNRDEFPMLDTVDTVVHLAGRAHVLKETATNPLAEYLQLNAYATERLAKAAAGQGIRRFVFISSIGVNGNATHDQAFTESDRSSPHNHYAASKLEAEERLIAVACDTGMEAVIIRPPLVYGPGVKGNFASLVRWAQKGLPLPLGAINNKRSFVALDNLVSFVTLCVDHTKSPLAANQIFLISDGEDVSTPELLRRVANAYGKNAYLVPVPERWLRLGFRLFHKDGMAERLLDSLVLDSSKARHMLGWRPVVSMEKQLQKMAQDVTHF